ncbi:hypothetical protein PAPYR_13371 [Paratrimastix pyriformis]|uniref:Uncharacterized protein n=1 Tax=Paratrimastix pyriformis TaxID=342808 RepID=A0ABQ8U4H5_9EUKA|nr:hypothetical protein PAPYR_13371 [Paratrimastix pyriformis]
MCYRTPPRVCEYHCVRAQYHQLSCRGGNALPTAGRDRMKPPKPYLSSDSVNTSPYHWIHEGTDGWNLEVPRTPVPTASFRDGEDMTMVVALTVMVADPAVDMTMVVALTVMVAMTLGVSDFLGVAMSMAV